MSKITAILLVSFMIPVFLAGSGCRLKPSDTVQPSVMAGNMGVYEATNLISGMFRKEGIKCAYNVKLDLRGIRFDANGYDYNMNIGFVYLVKSAAGVAGKAPPTAAEREALERLEKYERIYIAFIDEGAVEQVTARTDEFLRKLYKLGVIYKMPEYMGPDDAGAASDGAAVADSGQEKDAGQASK